MSHSEEYQAYHIVNKKV